MTYLTTTHDMPWKQNKYCLYNFQLIYECSEEDNNRKV
jgi:hypothetical protein